MNTTRSTQTDDLDRFETTLLAELRTIVADRCPVRRRSRRLPVAVAVASASAVTCIGFAVGSSSPAFAVHQEADGDVVVTIHRLDDANGLEQALAAQGVTADVDYAHPITMETTDGETVDVIPNLTSPSPELPPASTRVDVIQRGVPAGETLDCEFGKGGYITLDTVDGGYLLTIPHESVHADTPLHITTSKPGGLLGSLAVSSHEGQCIQIAASSPTNGS